MMLASCHFVGCRLAVLGYLRCMAVKMLQRADSLLSHQASMRPLLGGPWVVLQPDDLFVQTHTCLNTHTITQNPF